MATFTLTSETGRYALNPAALTLENGSGVLLLEDGSRLVLEVGSTREAFFVVAGSSALIADTAAYLLTGNAASFLAGVSLVADTGAYLFTGNPAAFATTGPATLVADTGAYLFTGNDATLTATGVVVERPSGGAGVAHTFTRKRWRELMDLIAAEKAARNKADQAAVGDPRREEALRAEVEAAQAAIFAAQIEGKNAELDRLLIRNANAIRASIRASAQVKLLKETARAITISLEIANRRKAEDDEDEMIMLLLAS